MCITTRSLSCSILYIKATVVSVYMSGQCLEFFSSHCPFPVVCFVEGGGGPGKLRNLLIWEFRSLWQLLPNWQLMDLTRERFKFRHPVDGWCVGGCWITLAQCDPMETMGWNWDFMDGVKLPPKGQFTWLVVFFFFLVFTFLLGFFFSLFFLFLEITHMCIMHRVHTS
jgi:hypothetical protein